MPRKLGETKKKKKRHKAHAHKRDGPSIHLSDRLKLLLWDGSGLVLVAKRLEQGSFRWPTIGDGVMRLTALQLSALLDRLDWTRVRAVRVRTPRAVL